MKSTSLECFTIATAEKLGISEDVVYELIMWQFDELKRQVHNNTSIEIAGIGRFYIRLGMLKHKINVLTMTLKVYEEQAKVEMTEKLEKKINSAKTELEFLITKTNTNEFQEYLGRLEKSSHSTKGDEGTDTNGTEGEA